MPINPNIALGVQPIQQPNMLGQMGQIMAIRAAQQEMEGNENTRNYFAKPISERGDPSQLLGTKQGQAAYKALNEGQIKQLEAEQKRINLVGAGAGAVLENPTMETFTTVVSDLVNRGIYTPQQRDQAFAAIGNDPSKIKAFVTPIFNQAISAEKRLSDITSRRNTDVSATAPMMNARLAREKYDDQLKYGGDLVTTTIPDPERPGQRIEIQTRRPLRGDQLIPLEVQPMPMRVEISPSSATSAFQPLTGGGGGTPNVLATQVAPQGSTFARPKESFTAPVPVIDKSGNTVLMQGREAVATGATPATPATEARQIVLRKLPDAIAQSRDALNLIDKMVGKEDGSTKPAPGFKGAVGTGIGLRFVPGTSESDFQAMYDQISGGAFLQAFNTLKGGGAITEKEGEKATAAITRMKLSTSEKAFMEAAREFQTVLRRGVATAQKELNAGAGGAPADPLGIR